MGASLSKRHVRPSGIGRLRSFSQRKECNRLAENKVVFTCFYLISTKTSTSSGRMDFMEPIPEIASNSYKELFNHCSSSKMIEPGFPQGNQLYTTRKLRISALTDFQAAGIRHHNRWGSRRLHPSPPKWPVFGLMQKSRIWCFCIPSKPYNKPIKKKSENLKLNEVKLTTTQC